MDRTSAEDIANLVSPTNVRLSPDARSVVYILDTPYSEDTEHSVNSLWLAETGKEGSAREIAPVKHYHANLQCSPDGKQISFVSDREKPGVLSTIYTLPATGDGEWSVLTSMTNTANINSYQWSPNSQFVAFISSDEQNPKGKDDAQTYGEDLEYARLRVVDVHSKETKVLAAPDEHIVGCAWSTDGSSLAYTTSRTPEMDEIVRATNIYILNVENKTTTLVGHFEGSVYDLTWLEDSLYWVGIVDGKYLMSSTALWKLDTRSTSSQPERIAYGETSCARGLRLCGDKVVVYVQEGMFDCLYVVKTGERLFSEKSDIGDGWDARIADGAHTLALTKAASPSHGEVYSAEGWQEVQLSKHSGSLSPHLRAQRVVHVERSASDGTPIDGIVYVASASHASSKPAPAVVIGHSGPYFRVGVGRDPIFSWTPWLLSLGYTVIHPSYRGGSGRGAAYAAATADDASQSYQDVVAVVKACVEDGLVDAHRVAMTGWSQGGFLTYLAITRDDTFHFAAAIAGAGVTCWDSLMITSDLPALQSAMSGTPPWLADSKDTSVRKASPIWFMQNINTPLLILQGELDPRTPLSQAVGFHRGMKARGKECEMIVYPREGHGYPRPFERLHYIHMLKKMETFLDKHLRK